MWTVQPHPSKTPGVTSGPRLSDGENQSERLWTSLNALTEAGGVVVGDEVSITFRSRIDTEGSGADVKYRRDTPPFTRETTDGWVSHSAVTIQDCVQS